MALLLLMASAVLGLQAAWSRWAVCFVDADPPLPGMATLDGACVAVQDHLYDYTIPSDPWMPIADAAQREGLSLLALGLPVVLLSLTVMNRWFIWVLGVAAGIAVGSVWLAMGVQTFLSGLAGEPVQVDDLAGVHALGVFAPFITLGLAVVAIHGDVGRDLNLDRDVWLGVFWAAMTVAQPLPELFTTLFLWSSHDTSPMTGFFRCAAVVVAAVAVAMTLVPARRRPARPGRRRSVDPGRRPRAGAGGIVLSAQWTDRPTPFPGVGRCAGR
ncbi:hypothetical protein FE374_00205 [Georgenia yuyongxinii]|uniref:Uncharacterized protein n=1 Tax=Georgenia yuyongxinii TaxID=2589797 RepID=A0A5B8BYA0_9MICO|nr:hypothetical protein [Georgenia yuyongxinii]QDC23264.1 hypothetical protein FE374_00205 [Georgenia yuyongxinii]